MRRVRSVVVAPAPSSGVKKLGQPVPLSDFVSEAKRGSPHPAHLKTPLRCSPTRGLGPARSVPCSRRTWYWAGESCLRHSASVISTSKWDGCSAASELLFESLLIAHTPNAPKSIDRLVILSNTSSIDTAKAAVRYRSSAGSG